MSCVASAEGAGFGGGVGVGSFCFITGFFGGGTIFFGGTIFLTTGLVTTGFFAGTTFAGTIFLTTGFFTGVAANATCVDKNDAAIESVTNAFVNFFIEVVKV